MPDDDLSALPRSAEEARKVGAKYYFTGKPCKFGHTVKRRVDNLRCMECVKLASRATKAKGSAALHCGHYACLAAIRLNQHVYQQRPDIVLKRRAYRKKWEELNKDRLRAAIADWARRHPEYAAEKFARRRWPITAALALHYQIETRKVYAACPSGMVVDHIIPLRHKLVCGLHAPWNMQYMTREANRDKSNSFDEALGIDYTAPGWRAQA